MGCDGFLDSFGPATFSHEEMEVKQHVLRKAQQKILLCDSSKFRKSSSYTFARWSDYDVLITDQITEQEQHMVSEVKQLICVSDEDYEFLWYDYVWQERYVYIVSVEKPLILYRLQNNTAQA